MPQRGWSFPLELRAALPVANRGELARSLVAVEPSFRPWFAVFGTPALWVRMNPEQRQRAMTWGQFRHRGIRTATGHLAAGAATVQVLILPVLIFVWAIAVAVIAAAT